MDPQQVTWLENELKNSDSEWKIPYHPPSAVLLGRPPRVRRAAARCSSRSSSVHNVSVVLTGHDHFYERTLPQKGIVYFVVGSGGKLRKGNIDRSSGITAKGNDTDNSFMAVEINGDEMTFNTVSRLGHVIDSGVITRRK